MTSRSSLAALTMALAASLSTAGCDGDGARGACAEGGSLGRCERDVVTPIDACDRMVACAAIPRESDEENGFDWGRCLDRFDSLIPAQESFVISCIGAATCDELKTQGSPDSPDNRGFCFEFGDR
jgi:hypothetical protein